MISIQLSDVVTDAPLMNARGVVVNVEGRLRLRCGGAVIFDEQSFPVAELAVALARWSGRGAERSSFEFDSMSAEEPGLVWFRRSEGEGWRVGSIWQDSPCMTELSLGELDNLTEQFVEEVRRIIDEIGGRQAAEQFDLALSPPRGSSC